MKSLIAFFVLGASLLASAQVVKYPSPCPAGMVVSDPAGRMFKCNSDHEWKLAEAGLDPNRPDWLPSWVTMRNSVIAASAFLLFILALVSFFTIHTKQAGIVERLGKFHRIAEAGLNFKVPILDRLVYVEDLNMQLMDVDVTSKTSDDATVTVPVRVQYFVLAEKVKEAYYELDDPEDQIKAHVENVILSHIPKITLDESYQQEDLIAERVKNNLSEAMSRFGYSIQNALVTQIVPSAEVLAAMNNINTQRRNAEAAKAQAETEKTLLIGKAEGEKRAQILAGEGVAGEQKAIVDGLRDSLKDFEEGNVGINSQQAVALIMMARYFDALKEIGADSNTIMLPHSPSAVSDMYSQLRETITASTIAARKAVA